MPGCATILPIPFLLAGLLALTFAAPEAADGRWTPAAILAVLGLVAAGIGVGMHIGFRSQRARARRLAARQASWPDDPWRWREGWADGPITDATRQQMIASWFFAALWNAIALPSTAFGIREALRRDEQALWLVTVFGVVGIGLLVNAIVQTVRHRRFGASALELETFPGFLGGTLAGRIRVALDLHELPRIPIVLRCVRPVAPAGGSAGRQETVLWEHRLEVVRTHRDGAFTVIHFAFRLPADLPQSAWLPGTDPVTWRLDAEAAAPGVNYQASFEVPVFAPPAGAILPAGDLPIAVGFDDYTQPPASRIVVTTTRRGTEVWMPAARHVVPGLLVTGLGVVLGGIGVALLWSDAPRILAWLVCILGGVLGLAAANLWFGTSRILASSRGLEVSRGFLGLGRTRVIPAAEIQDITSQSGMQANARYYSDLAVALPGGRRVMLGRAIREKREAEYIADRLLSALGR